MNLILIAALLGPADTGWPRMAVTQPYADFLGWSSDTAWVNETVIHDLAGEVEETTYLVTPEGTESAAVPGTVSLQPGTVVADMQSIVDGTASYVLNMEYSEEELLQMHEACLNFEDHLVGPPPMVHLELSLVRTQDSVEVWSASRDLTWFGGECAPIFDLPVLDAAILSPDSSMLFFSILYGPWMEYFTVSSRM